MPPYYELLWPALQAVAELGGSASISEIAETVIKREGFSDAQQAVLHNDGPETEIGYRLAWARTYLKGMGLLTNSSRGVWALTDNGTALLTDPSATDDQRSESGDGGIAGLGVYRLGLVSFPVFFQCKRYRGSVSPSAVRDFRGAMAGRGDKGLFGTQSGGTLWPTRQWQCAAAYEAYARHLATEGAKRWGSGYSIHQLDVEAMKASMPGGTLPHGWTPAPLPSRP